MSVLSDSCSPCVRECLNSQECWIKGEERSKMEATRSKMDELICCLTSLGMESKMEAGISFRRNPSDLGCLAICRDL